MSEVLTWLKPQDETAGAPPLLKRLKELGATPETASGADGYLAGLLAGVEVFTKGAMTWNDFFLGSDEQYSLSLTPGGALYKLLKELEGTVRVSPLIASKLAESYALAGNRAAASLSAKAAFLSGGREKRALAILLDAALEENALGAAREIAEILGRLYPGEEEALLGAAHVAKREGRFDEALSLLDPLLKGPVPSGAIVSLYLDICLEGKKAGEAVRLAEGLVGGLLEEPALAYKAARVHYQAGNLDRAEELLNSLKESLSGESGLNGPMLKVVSLEALELALLRNSPGTADKLKMLAPEVAGNPELTLRLAQALRKAGEGKAAGKVLRASLDDGSATTATLMALGRLLFAEGRDQEAFNLFQAASEADPSKGEPLFYLSMICLRNRQFALAAELGEAAASLDLALAPRALLAVSDAHRLSGNLAKGAAALASAFENAPEDAAIIGEVQKRLPYFQKN